MRFVYLSLLFILSACATTAKYEKALNSWMGSDESELVSRFGPPD